MYRDRLLCPPYGGRMHTDLARSGPRAQGLEVKRHGILLDDHLIDGYWS